MQQSVEEILTAHSIVHPHVGHGVAQQRHHCCSWVGYNHHLPWNGIEQSAHSFSTFRRICFLNELESLGLRTRRV